ncbi:MAG TPA: hypothetical protein VFZ13_04125 [Gemmatimonadales bacterium]
MTDRFAIRGLLAVPLAIGMAACSSTQVETSPDPVVVTTPAVDTVAVGVPAGANTPAANRPADTTVAGYQASGAGAGGMTHTVALDAQNASGFTGNAVFTDLGGGKTRIAFTLNAPANTDANAQHDVRIHSGTCAAPGAEVKNLDDVQGNGQASDSEVDLSMTALMDGNHIIIADENNGDRIVACAAIPKRM